MSSRVLREAPYLDTITETSDNETSLTSSYSITGENFNSSSFFQKIKLCFNPSRFRYFELAIGFVGPPADHLRKTENDFSLFS